MQLQKVKYVPRDEGLPLKIEPCPLCGALNFIDVYAFYGLPEKGWKVCGICGYQEGLTGGE